MGEKRSAHSWITAKWWSCRMTILQRIWSHNSLTSEERFIQITMKPRDWGEKEAVLTACQGWVFVFRSLTLTFKEHPQTNRTPHFCYLVDPSSNSGVLLLSISNGWDSFLSCCQKRLLLSLPSHDEIPAYNMSARVTGKDLITRNTELELHLHQSVQQGERGLYSSPWISHPQSAHQETNGKKKSYMPGSQGIYGSGLA